jgi:hypothetical protein
LLFLFLVSSKLAVAPPVWAELPVPPMDPAKRPAPNTGCLAPGLCHAGIEPIRAHDSEMAHSRIHAQRAPAPGPGGRLRADLREPLL